MSLKRVDPNGTIEINFPTLSGVTVVGAGNTLADSDDATYVEGDPDGLNYDVEMDALTSYDDGDPITLHVRLSLESEDHTGTDADVFLFLQDNHPTNISGTYYVGQFTSGSYNSAAAFPPPFDGTPKELVLPLVVRPGHTLAECVAVLESGTAYVAVNALHIVDAGPLHARVYEMWIEVGETVLSPCYQTLTVADLPGSVAGHGFTYGTLDAYAGRSILDLGFEFTATAATGADFASVGIYAIPDGVLGGWTPLATVSGFHVAAGEHTYSHTFTDAELSDTYAAIKAALAGDAVFAFEVAGDAPSVTLSGASVRVGHKCVVNVAPLRQYPRADGLGVGPKRHYPLPKSRRAAGGYR